MYNTVQSGGGSLLSGLFATRESKDCIHILVYSKAPSYTAPRCTDPADKRFLGGPKFFQIHGFPNVGYSFTPQLHGYELCPIIKKVTRYFKIHLDSVTRGLTVLVLKVRRKVFSACYRLKDIC